MITFNQDCAVRLGQEMTTKRYADHVIPKSGVSGRRLSVERSKRGSYCSGLYNSFWRCFTREGVETINSVDDQVFHVLGLTADALHERK